MRSIERPLTRGMRVAAWTTAVYALFELAVLPMMVRRSPVGWVFAPSTAVQVGLTSLLAVLMFRGVVASYYAMGVYGIWRLALAGVAVGAILTGAAERLGNIWVLGMLVAVPFASGWCIGLVAVWRSGRRASRESADVARAV